MAKYNFVFNGKQTICISHYAHRPVKGYAYCMDEDEYDKDKGAKIAKAKCDLKIANKRLKRATKKLHETMVNLKQTCDNYTIAANYYEDALKEVKNVENELKELLV